MIDPGDTVVENNNEVPSSWSLYFHRGNYIGHKNTSKNKPESMQTWAQSTV